MNKEQPKGLEVVGYDSEPAFYISELDANTIKHTALINGKISFGKQKTDECTVPIYWDQTQSATTHAEQVRAETIEECAVAAWNYFMDMAKKKGCAPVSCEDWLASPAIRALGEKK